MKVFSITVPSDIKALIFDCDGTLVDTMPIHIRAWEKTFLELGEECPIEWLESLKGMPEEAIVFLYNETYNKQYDPGTVVKIKHVHFRSQLHLTRPIQPVVDVALKYRGRLPMAVVSGGTRDNVLLSLEVIEIRPFFDVILTADDDIPAKPEPDIFLEAAHRIGVNPEACQVFEDGDIGLSAARRAGMTATDIRPFL